MSYPPYDYKYASQMPMQPYQVYSQYPQPLTMPVYHYPPAPEPVHQNNHFPKLSPPRVNTDKTQILPAFKSEPIADKVEVEKEDSWYLKPDQPRQRWKRENDKRMFMFLKELWLKTAGTSLMESIIQLNGRFGKGDFFD